MAKTHIIFGGAAMALLIVMTSVHAQSAPPSPAEVAARWKSYFGSSSFRYYRDPVVVRQGTYASVWTVSVPTSSMSKLGVPTIYQRVTFDCTTKRKKIMEIKRFKADGSIQAPPAKDVKLDNWFPTLSVDDTILQKEVCLST